MDTKDQIANFIRNTNNDSSVYNTVDKIISLINRDYMNNKKDSILTLESICREYENFLLHDEKSYNNSVIIQSLYHENAFFVLQGSYHLQIACTSLCGNYTHTAYDADYERNYTKGWRVIDTFTSKEELEIFTEINNDIAYKYQFGNGMTAYLVDLHLEYKEGEIEEKQLLYYIDEETGLVYQDSTFGFDEREFSSFISVATGKDTYKDQDYYGPGQSEELYYQIQFGLDGLKEYLKESYKNNSLSKMYHRIEYKITKLGKL